MESIIKQKPQILIIDDEPTNLSILIDILKPEYDISVARDAFVSLKRLSKKPLPDLILLDIRMPVMDGFELCRKIKSDEEIGAIPVIFLSQIKDPDTEIEGLALGAVDFITKPFHAENVKSRVALHLTQHNQHLEIRDRYNTVFDHSTHGIIIHDEAGNVLEVNDAFCTLSGYPREEVFLISPGDIHDKADALLFKKRIKQVLHQGYGFFQLFLYRKDGGKIYVETKVRPIVFEGEPAIMAIFSDLTEQKATETELAKCKNRLDTLIFDIPQTEKEDEPSLPSRKRTKKEPYQQNVRNMVGRSDAMLHLHSKLDELANMPSTVLITGESGTGKDLVAEALHFGGNRADSPFVRVACSDLSEDLIESELFGHIKGAFTGALNDRIGRFEKAGNGTLFLDEIGDISPRFQKRLLRVLEERSFERVGESRPLSMDARIVAATNQNLAELVHQTKFRSDLYYRLKVVEIHMPPLRERMEDIEPLVYHFMALFSKQFDTKARHLSPAVLDRLQAHAWPGNVRELRHVIEYACMVSKMDTISEKDLPDEFQHTDKPQNNKKTTIHRLPKKKWMPKASKMR